MNANQAQKWAGRSKLKNVVPSPKRRKGYQLSKAFTAALRKEREAPKRALTFPDLEKAAAVLAAYDTETKAEAENLAAPLPPAPPREKKIHAPSYTRDIFNPNNFPWMVESTAKAVEEFERRYLDGKHVSALAFSGNSGILVPAVAYLMKKPFYSVRQQGTYTHDCRMVNGDFSALSYLIIDDFVSSGATVEHIMQQIDRAAHADIDATNMPYPECVGIIETQGGYLTDGGSGRKQSFTINGYDYWREGRMQRIGTQGFTVTMARLNDLVPGYEEIRKINLAA